MKKLIIICLLLTFSGITGLPLSQAQATENSATPSVLTETGARLMLLEVNFKHKDNDFARFKYTSPLGKPWNMKGILFKDDGTIKKIENDLWIAAGQELALIWKKEDTDAPPYLYTNKTGLTGTTEQLIIQSSDGTVLDAVCWTSASPTASEKSDMEDLFEAGGWHSAAVESCILSDSIETNASIYRKINPDGTPADTNSALDWQITDPSITSNETSTNSANTNADEDDDEASTEHAAPPSNLSTTAPPTLSSGNSEPSSTSSTTATQTTSAAKASQPTTSPQAAWNGPSGVDITGSALSQKELAEIAQLATDAGFTILPPEGLELKDLDLTALTASKAGEKNSKSKGSSKESIYQNGDLSTEVIITELLPNPEGTDTKAEWIEIMNISGVAVNLGNWSLDDIEDGGSKPYILPDTITLTPGEIMLFPITETKISLGNGSDSVRLLDFEETVIDEVTYESAPSGESFTRVTIINEEGEEEFQWIWSKDPTPGEENPMLQKFQAEVAQEPQFEEEHFFMASVTGSSGAAELKTVYFTEEVIAGPLAKTTFKKGTKLNLLAQQQDESSFRLQQFELTQEAQTQQNGPGSFMGVTLLIIIAVMVLGGYVLYKKLLIKQDAPEEELQTKVEPSGPV